MDFLIEQDIESVLEITGFTLEELAGALEVSRVTASNWLNAHHKISGKHMVEFYEYIFKKGIRLNKIKEQFYREEMEKEKEVLLFHGAKTQIDGSLRTDCNKKINDFGNGFYCGESLEQSAMFVSAYKTSSLYMLKFNPSGLACRMFDVNREWMLTIAYYRGKLEEYRDHEIIQKLIKKNQAIDYIIAPIADNRMFEIIDSFIDGEITDVQCQHCLSATDLGKQYVFVSQKALDKITLLERCFLTDSEKAFYLNSKRESFRMNMDKVKLARRQYRNQGDYIEEILQ